MGWENENGCLRLRKVIKGKLETFFYNYFWFNNIIYHSFYA